MLAGCGRKTPAQPSQPDVDPNGAATEQSPGNATVAVQDDSSSDPKLDREAVVSQAEELARRGDYEAAASALQSLLLVEPNNYTLLFRLANVEAARGDIAKAVELLDGIPENDPIAGLPALGQSAQWCVLLERFEEAERRYLKVLAEVPQAAPARRQLAQLLNRQGRRQEATVHIHELCRQGNIRHDELQSLIMLNEGVYDDSPQASGEVSYLPIGPGGEARIQFGKKKYQQVIELLEPVIANGDVTPSTLALFGRAAAEIQDDERFAWWLARTDDRTKEFGDYWAAIGTYESSHRRFDTATRALGEAIDRNPTDYLSMGRIRQCLTTLGNDELTKRWADRWLAVRETAEAHVRVTATNPPNPDAIGELASLLFHMNRPLEAALWKSIEAYHRGSPKSELERWNAERTRLVTTGTGLPSRSERLCGMDLSEYPLPDLKSLPAPREGQDALPGNAEVAKARVDNVAEQIGLKHTYQIASQFQEKQNTIYQTLGGGVAVLDYDLDGMPDLYLAQGAADSPSYQGELTNQLYRHLGSSVIDVTQSSRTADRQYSIGVSAGDWNQDGFPDLVVANIGTDRLLINNGDGTFTPREISASADTTRVPSSTAMADITGDHLPDIVQLVYVDDENIGFRPDLDDDGRVIEKVSPGDFEMGPDQLIVNDGSGGFVRRTLGEEANPHTGLGVIVTDLTDNPGNEVFVGNDLYPNQLWIRDADSGQWSDAAAVMGCAFGFSGLATGSMGIATGDFDANGLPDIHVTNFDNEHSSLYMGRRGAFRDENVYFRLAEPTRPMVGFGTQAIDYENDGDLDLVVTNGHLDDSLDNNTAFKQPPQLFCNLGDRFQVVDAEDPSSYWSGDHLGRGLARLDFNQDGKNDFVITHISEPTALILNQTRTDHDWLQLQLVGTESERDAIGARIEVTYGGQEVVEWVVAGDGYLSRNEAVVSFGLGESESVDQIRVHWPSGKQQTFGGVAGDQRLLIIENEDVPTVLFRAATQ